MVRIRSRRIPWEVVVQVVKVVMVVLFPCELSDCDPELVAGAQRQPIARLSGCYRLTDWQIWAKFQGGLDSHDDCNRERDVMGDISVSN